MFLIGLSLKHFLIRQKLDSNQVKTKVKVKSNRKNLFDVKCYMPEKNYDDERRIALFLVTTYQHSIVYLFLMVTCCLCNTAKGQDSRLRQQSITANCSEYSDREFKYINYLAKCDIFYSPHSTGCSK